MSCIASLERSVIDFSTEILVETNWVRYVHIILILLSPQ